ncbi:MAG: hypothetical protein M3024_07940 [Candidatus Dormibacteraeota bacterium]|nr:hypothetical protein [Candidatus Dormibacteraeota bacterium]
MSEQVQRTPYVKDRDETIDRLSAEMQQRWHGWGSPVGLGIAMVSFGAFLVMIGEAVRLIFR